MKTDRKYVRAISAINKGLEKALPLKEYDREWLNKEEGVR